MCSISKTSKGLFGRTSLTFAFLLLLAPLCAAGEYDVEYSGGEVRVTGPANIPWTFGYGDRGSGWWGGSHFSCNQAVPPFEPNAGSGSVLCHETVSMTATWNTDLPLTDPEPECVLVIIEAEARWMDQVEIGSGYSDNDLEDDEVLEAPGGYSTGTFYDIVYNPSTPLEYTISPEAFCTSAYVAEALVQVRMRVVPIRVAFQGVLDYPTDNRIMIGRPLAASLDLGGVPIGSGATYSWSVSGGNPFSDYVIDDYSGVPWSLGDVIPVGSITTPTIDYGVYFREPDDEFTVSCTFYWPTIGESVTVQSNGATEGPINLAFGATPHIVTLHGGGVMFGEWPISAPHIPGIKFQASVETPEEFQNWGPGHAYFVQFITPHRQVDGEVPYDDRYALPALNGKFGLDGRFPYREMVFDADGAPFSNYDSPVESVKVSGTYVLDSFLVYLMYEPPGFGAKPVCIKALNWFWEAETHAPSWTLTSDKGWDYEEGEYSDQPEWTRLHDTAYIEYR